MDKLREREAGSKEPQRLNFNQQHNAIPLRSAQPGTPLQFKDMGTTGTIAQAAEKPTVYHENFAGVLFCGLAIFLWFAGINFCGSR